MEPDKPTKKTCSPTCPVRLRARVSHAVASHARRVRLSDRAGRPERQRFRHGRAFAHYLCTGLWRARAAPHGQRSAFSHQLRERNVRPCKQLMPSHQQGQSYSRRAASGVQSAMSCWSGHSLVNCKRPILNCNGNANSAPSPAAPERDVRKDVIRQRIICCVCGCTLSQVSWRAVPAAPLRSAVSRLLLLVSRRQRGKRSAPRTLRRP